MDNGRAAGRGQITLVTVCITGFLFIGIFGVVISYRPVADWDAEHEGVLGLSTVLLAGVYGLLLFKTTNVREKWLLLFVVIAAGMFFVVSLRSMLKVISRNKRNLTTDTEGFVRYKIASASTSNGAHEVNW